MPKLACPVAGFEQVEVTVPDEWLMGHINRFYQGYNSDPEAAPALREIYGTIALCDAITGVDLKDVANKPLRWRPFFRWLVEAVYTGSYLLDAAAIEAQKKT